jgi:hypothetical protein
VSDPCSYLHNRLRLDGERIILSDQNTAPKAHKRPPRLIQTFRAPFSLLRGRRRAHSLLMSRAGPRR